MSDGPRLLVCHCRTCKHLRNYDGEQGFNPISKAGWCVKLGRLRYAQVTRTCNDFEIIGVFYEANNVLSR